MFLSLDLSFLKCFKSIVNIIIISIDHFFCAINSRGRSAHCTLQDEIVKRATPPTALSLLLSVYLSRLHSRSLSVPLYLSPDRSVLRVGVLTHGSHGPNLESGKCF